MSGHLRQAALGWQRQADITGYTYARARHAVDAVPWSGAGADGARAKLAANLARILDSLAVLNQAQRIATQGADAIDAAKRVAVEAIQNAVSQFFDVSEDLSVTDRMPAFFSAALALVRKIAAAHMQADIRGRQ